MNEVESRGAAQAATRAERTVRRDLSNKDADSGIFGAPASGAEQWELV